MMPVGGLRALCWDSSLDCEWDGEERWGAEEGRWTEVIGSDGGTIWRPLVAIWLEMVTSVTGSTLMVSLLPLVSCCLAGGTGSGSTTRWLLAAISSFSFLQPAARSRAKWSRPHLTDLRIGEERRVKWRMRIWEYVVWKLLTLVDCNSECSYSRCQ